MHACVMVAVRVAVLDAKFCRAKRGDAEPPCNQTGKRKRAALPVTVNGGTLVSLWNTHRRRTVTMAYSTYQPRYLSWIGQRRLWSRLSRNPDAVPMYKPQFGQYVCATSGAGKLHGASRFSSIRSREVGVSHASPRTHTLIATLRAPSPQTGNASCTESGSGRPALSTFDQNKALPATGAVS